MATRTQILSKVENVFVTKSWRLKIVEGDASSTRVPGRVDAVAFDSEVSPNFKTSTNVVGCFDNDQYLKGILSRRSGQDKKRVGRFLDPDCDYLAW